MEMQTICHCPFPGSEACSLPPSKIVLPGCEWAGHKMHSWLSHRNTLILAKLATIEDPLFVIGQLLHGFQTWLWIYILYIYLLKQNDMSQWKPNLSEEEDILIGILMEKKGKYSLQREEMRQSETCILWLSRGITELYGPDSRGDLTGWS